MGKFLNRHFINGDTQMFRKHLRSCLFSVVIKEIHIIIYHCTPTKIATIIKTDKTKYGFGDGTCRTFGTLIHFWPEVKMTLL